MGACSSFPVRPHDDHREWFVNGYLILTECSSPFLQEFNLRMSILLSGKAVFLRGGLSHTFEPHRGFDVIASVTSERETTDYQFRGVIVCPFHGRYKIHPDPSYCRNDLMHKSKFGP